MIKKLKIKFVALATVATLFLLAVVVVGMNVLNYVSVVDEMDDILELLSHNKGNFPNMEDGKGGKKPIDMSPELPYQTRFFSVLINEDGGIQQIDTSRIASVDAESAGEYALKAVKKNKEKGFIDSFRFLCSDEPMGKRVTFLDCSRQIDSFKLYLFSGITMAAAGVAVTFVVMAILSGRIIHPVAESYEKQRRFITDAGHEIKTPLTIINANADLLEMEIGENESIQEIHHQTRRLTDLTNYLVYLAKMEEENTSIPMTNIPLSDIVEETVQSFKALTHTRNKTFTYDVQPMLSMIGNGKDISELVSILLDNALKYSGENGFIDVKLEKYNKIVYLTVFNTTATEITKENLPMLFERFYRTDASRNSGTGGHGIGLSIAKAIVEAHNGKLHAVSKDGYSLQITVSFSS